MPQQRIINLRERLSQRVHKEDILELQHYIQQDKQLRDEIYQLIFEDDKVAYQALWVCTHFSRADFEWLSSKHDELIDAVLTCTHSPNRRMFLSLIYNCLMPEEPRLDLLDFCLDRMSSYSETSAIKSLCIKLAYCIAEPIPELSQELQSILEMMEPDLLPPAVRCVRKNTLKAIDGKKKSSS